MTSVNTLALPFAALAAGITRAGAAEPVRMGPAPEPMETVRVCDVYGAGFFYIPGTEACLKLSGHVRYRIGATGEGPGDTPNWYGFARDEWTKEAKAELDFDARSATGWGTLRSFIRVRATGTDVARSADPTAALDRGFIQLGGFAAGYMQSAFAGTFNGGASNDGTHSDDGLDFGDQKRQAVQYNFGSGEGFFATLSLENDPGSGNYVPDIVGKAGYAAGRGTVHALAGYDESDGSFAARAGLALDVAPAVDGSVRLLGLYSGSPANSYWATARWSVQASYGQQMFETVFASFGGQYWQDVSDGGAFVAGVGQYALEGSLAWTPVENLEIRAEANYVKADGLDGAVAGYLWFQRSF